MIYDSPIVRASFSSAALVYALVCAEAALPVREGPGPQRGLRGDPRLHAQPWHEIFLFLGPASLPEGSP